VQSAECRVQNEEGDIQMRTAKFGMRSSECRIEYGEMRRGIKTKGKEVFSRSGRRVSFRR